MRIVFTSCRRYERESFLRANAAGAFELDFHDCRLDSATASLAAGAQAVCLFVNDDGSAPVLEALARGGTRLVLLRSAGFNHVDVAAAARLGLALGYVPAYSPHAVAEHAFALLLTLNRKTHRAYARVRELNFSLDGLVGFDLHGRTVGVVGTGRIGTVFAKIAHGFGMHVLAADPVSRTAGAFARYVDINTLLAESDVVSLHCPLTPQTRHVIDATALACMKPDAVLLNTGRGALVDTPALIDALKARRLRAVGLDVYEEEAGVFFQDLSDRGIDDDQLARLLTFPNVLVTSHQGFLTREALDAIAATTLENAASWQRDGAVAHPVPPP